MIVTIHQRLWCPTSKEKFEFEFWLWHRMLTSPLLLRLDRWDRGKPSFIWKQGIHQTETEIKNLINDLPNKLSSGYDDISNILLKKLIDVLTQPFHMLFNRSLLEGVFPVDMKLADVVPLYKSGSHFMMTNYRPISLLPTISKWLEKVVYKRVYDFFIKENLLFKSQYGFRKKHSCEHAIPELLGGYG